MRPTSSRWLDGLYQDHRLATRVTHVQTGEVLEYESGSVTLDITASARGQLSMTFSDRALIPVDHESLLAPYGQELGIERGLWYPDGTREMVPLGIFRIEEVEVNLPADGTQPTISIVAPDRSQTVADAVFEDQYSITGGTNYIAAILQVITDGYPDVETADGWPTGAQLCPTLTAERGDDRWVFAQTMAQAIGMNLYFDANGKLALTTIADIGGDPVATVTEGEDGVSVAPSLLDLNKKWTRTDAHNKWIVVGDNPDTESDAPVAYAIDNDPNSPTWWDGPFGHKPEVYSSTFVSDQAQCQQAADGKKAKEAGTSQVLNFGALVNPALEPEDIVLVKRTSPNLLDASDTIEVVNENNIIDSLTIPLTASDAMTSTTRARRIVG